MDACLAVEREIDQVLSNFGNLRENYSNVLQDLIDNLESIKDNLPVDTNDGKIHF